MFKILVNKIKKVMCIHQGVFQDVSPSRPAAIKREIGKFTRTQIADVWSISIRSAGIAKLFIVSPPLFNRILPILRLLPKNCPRHVESKVFGHSGDTAQKGCEKQRE